MFCYGPLQMAEKKQGDQLEPTYSSFMRIRGVAWGTYQKRWTIGRSGERGSAISVLVARQDDDLCRRFMDFFLSLLLPLLLLNLRICTSTLYAIHSNWHFFCGGNWLYSFKMLGPLIIPNFFKYYFYYLKLPHWAYMNSLIKHFT